MAGSESLKRAHKRLLVKMQPSFSRDPSIVEMPVPWDASQAAVTMKCGYPEPGRQAVYAAEGGAREAELPKPFGARKIISLRDPTRSFTLLDFGFALI